jgi:hypothetical protein
MAAYYVSCSVIIWCWVRTEWCSADIFMGVSKEERVSQMNTLCEHTWYLALCSCRHSKTTHLLEAGTSYGKHGTVVKNYKAVSNLSILG